MVVIVNARASTNRVDFAGYKHWLCLFKLNFENTTSVLQMPYLGKRSSNRQTKKSIMHCIVPKGKAERVSSIKRPSSLFK